MQDDQARIDWIGDVTEILLRHLPDALELPDLTDSESVRQYLRSPILAMAADFAALSETPWDDTGVALMRRVIDGDRTWAILWRLIQRAMPQPTPDGDWPALCYSADDAAPAAEEIAAALAEEDAAEGRTGSISILVILSIISISIQLLWMLGRVIMEIRRRRRERQEGA